ncbi:unnamed protein product [Lactuca virosa]|uniref:Uncharacterized protein n=1 Tax=Lactuca virosa TaxID=75947 RepID=A0AAU9NBV5_9ASTR|nr:unnamed protein product [Lactuca virosa]
MCTCAHSDYFIFSDIGSDLVLFVLTFTLDAYIVTKEWHVVVRVDYIPSRVDLPALGHGKYVELVIPFQWKLSWQPSTVVLDWHLLAEDIVYVFLCCYCGFGNILAYWSNYMYLT